MELITVLVQIGLITGVVGIQRRSIEPLAALTLLRVHGATLTKVQPPLELINYAIDHGISAWIN